MADIALFHSALGVRPGVVDAAERLRAVGHRVLVVDQYQRQVFDSYEEAGAFVESIGWPELMRRAAAAAQDLADVCFVAGFSNGGAMAEYVATVRRVSGVVMLSGTLPLTMIGIDSWPAGVPAQIHYTVDDPFRRQENIDALVSQIQASGSEIQVFDYPGNGHLFTDASLPDEYDSEAADVLWGRVIGFCDRAGH